MDKGVDASVDPDTVAGAGFPNDIIRNRPPHPPHSLLSSGWLQAGTLLVRPLPPPDSQPRSSKHRRGSLFFMVVAERNPWLVLIGSEEVWAPLEPVTVTGKNAALTGQAGHMPGLGSRRLVRNLPKG